MVGNEELRDRIERLEADLIAAQRVVAKSLVTEQLSVRELSPMSIFDRHGAMAIVFAIFLQTAGAIWWASGLSSQVDGLRQQTAEHSAIMAAMSRTIQENAERLTRVQSVQENVVKILDRFQSEFNKRGPG